MHTSDVFQQIAVVPHRCFRYALIGLSGALLYAATAFVSADESPGVDDPESGGDHETVVDELPVDNSGAGDSISQYAAVGEIPEAEYAEDVSTGESQYVQLSLLPASPAAEPIYDQLPEEMIGGGYKNIAVLVRPPGGGVGDPSTASDNPVRQMYADHDGELFWAQAGDIPDGARAVLFDPNFQTWHLGPPAGQYQELPVPPTDAAGSEDAQENPHNIYSNVGLGLGYVSSPTGEDGGYESVSGELQEETNVYDDPPQGNTNGTYDEPPDARANNKERRPRKRDNPNRRATVLSTAEERPNTRQADLMLLWTAPELRRQAIGRNLATVQAVIQRRQPPQGPNPGGWMRP